MKRKALARALALALCLMLCVPAMATSWGLTEQTSSAVAAGALYAGEEAALTGTADGIGASPAGGLRRAQLRPAKFRPAPDLD